MTRYCSCVRSFPSITVAILFSYRWNGGRFRERPLWQSFVSDFCRRRFGACTGGFLFPAQIPVDLSLYHLLGGGSAQLSRGWGYFRHGNHRVRRCCALVFGQGQGRLQLSDANVAVYRSPVVGDVIVSDGELLTEVVQLSVLLKYAVGIPMSASQGLSVGQPLSSSPRRPVTHETSLANANWYSGVVRVNARACAARDWVGAGEWVWVAVLWPQWCVWLSECLLVSLSDTKRARFADARCMAAPQATDVSHANFSDGWHRHDQQQRPLDGASWTKKCTKECTHSCIVWQTAQRHFAAGLDQQWALPANYIGVCPSSKCINAL